MIERVLNMPVKQTALVKCQYYRHQRVPFISHQYSVSPKICTNAYSGTVFRKYSAGQNILELYNVLVYVRFAIRQQDLITYLVEESQCSIRVFFPSCQTTLRLNDYSKLEIVKKTSNLGGNAIKEKQNFCNSNQKGRKRRYQRLLVHFNFSRFPYPTLHAFRGQQV